MTWVRIDEGFPEHPKVIAAGPLASWLHVCALAYCNRQLTDGFISAAVLPRLSDGKRSKALAAALVDAGLWELANGGWLIHDFLTYQPSKAKVEAERAAARERMANNRRSSPSVRESSPNVRANNDRSSGEVRITRPGPSRSVPITSQSSVNSNPQSVNGHDDDDFTKTLKILVEHKARMKPPDNRIAWEATVVPNTIHENGDQIRTLLTAGKAPLEAAGAILKSMALAELAAMEVA